MRRLFVANRLRDQGGIPGCTQAGPHARSKVGSTAWCYDANGNQTKELTSATDYRHRSRTGFDLPEKSVRRASQIGIEQSTEFRYAPRS